MDGAPQCSGALAVDNPDTGKMGQIGIIQIFVQLVYGLVHRLAQQIDLRGDGHGLGHLQLAGASGTAAGDPGGGGDGAFIDQDQIFHIGLGADDAALHEKSTLGVGQAADGALKAHGEDFYGVALFELGRIHGFSVRLCRAVLVHGQIGIFLVDLVPELLTPLLQLPHVRSGIYLVEIPDGDVRNFLGLLKDFPGLFVGLPEDLVSGLIQLVVLLLQLFLQGPDLLLVSCDLLLLSLDGHAALFQICDHVLEAFVLHADLLSGSLYDIAG